MLIHFRFHPICNEHIIQNYERMLGESLKLGYHAGCAFVDCVKHSVAHRYGFHTLAGVNLELTLDRLVRLKATGSGICIPE